MSQKDARKMKSRLDTLGKLEMAIDVAGGIRELAEIYNISDCTVSNWHNRLRSVERVKRWKRNDSRN